MAREYLAKTRDRDDRTWLERVFDFSIHFNVNNESVEIQAFTRLFNNARGQFKAFLATVSVQSETKPSTDCSYPMIAASLASTAGMKRS